jgi:hypothetical protein
LIDFEYDFSDNSSACESFFVFNVVWGEVIERVDRSDLVKWFPLDGFDIFEVAGSKPGNPFELAA